MKIMLRGGDLFTYRFINGAIVTLVHNSSIDGNRELDTEHLGDGGLLLSVVRNGSYLYQKELS